MASGEDRPEPLIDFSQPFGMTLLGNRAATELSWHHDRAAGGLPERPSRRRRAALLRELHLQGSTVSDDDAVLDATGPDGARSTYGFEICRIWRARVLRADRQAYDRCFLSDTHGVPVVLDGHALHWTQAFDLRHRSSGARLCFRSLSAR